MMQPKTSKLQAQIPSSSTWAIARTKSLNPMVKQCIINQIKGYQLLSNVLFVIFSICTRLQTKYQVCIAMNPPLMCQELDKSQKLCMPKWVLRSSMCWIPFWHLYLPSTLFLRTTLCLLTRSTFKKPLCAMEYACKEKNNRCRIL